MTESKWTPVGNVPIRITDLNLALFEDPALAPGVAPDALRLFEPAALALDDLWPETWYRRLWVVVTAGATRKLAEVCRNAAESRQLLLRVLQAHAQTNPRSHALLEEVARGLHEQGAADRFARALIELADSVTHARNDGASGGFDPGDEHTWDEAARTLLFKVMVIAALADNQLAPEEQELLDHKLRELGLSDDARQEADAFMAHPSSLSDELVGIDDYRMRKVLFRHALGVIYADGRLDPGERMHLEVLASALGIEEGDRRQMMDAFARVQGEVPMADLVHMIRARPRRLDAVATDLDTDTDPGTDAEGSREEALRQARARLAEVGPTWAEYYSDLLAQALVAPILQRGQAYAAISATAGYDLVDALDPRALLDALNPWLARVLEVLEETIAQIGDWAPLPASVNEQLGATWQDIQENDAGWEHALADVGEAGEQLLDAIPRGTERVTGESLAAAGDPSLVGPAALVARATAIEVGADADLTGLYRAADRWDAAVARLFETTGRWQDMALRYLLGFFLDVVGATHAAMADIPLNEGMVYPVLQMIEHMEPDAGEAEHGHRGGAETCPTCGRVIGPGAAGCEVCGVAAGT